MMISYATTTCVILFLFSCSSLAFSALEQREDCYETDTLRSFQHWIDDAVQYCSSILSISDTTTFVGPTKSLTTTISTVTATTYDTVETVTVPQATAFATTTTTNGQIVLRREDSALNVPFVVAPIPIAATATANDPIISQFPSDAQNASIAAEDYSACSCLGITSSTVTAAPSVLSV
ncbi:MAG: hypothetical protein ASARMPRED_006482 [Alectoria sarmentosa]|nr:MAG: hypothetical protein ASARMPRED_006482 [Alectoria sarmentosa]